MTSLEALLWADKNNALVEWGFTMKDGRRGVLLNIRGVNGVEVWRPTFLEAVIEAKKLIEALTSA